MSKQTVADVGRGEIRKADSLGARALRKYAFDVSSPGPMPPAGFEMPVSLSKLFVLAAAILGTGPVRAAEGPDYLRQVKPLLRGRCYSCHGALKQEAGLRLDTAALMLKGGDSGAAIAKGQPEESLILSRVTSMDPDIRMPPALESEPLSAEQVTLIREWIAAGASAPADEKPESDPRRHWAFQPVLRPKVPREESDWVRNPIDAFLARGHRESGLTPREETSRVILLRRLSFDLIGLPPTLKEIEAVLADKSEDWYERTVTRLLDDPRYGERWGRHWMDVWRYSDWWGLGAQLRNSQKHIWHWRDWIVESLNEDVPYDEMVRLQLAADELHPDDLDKLRATGFLARNWFLFNRPQWMDETVEHVSKGFLGLTMNCARCHAHKYDPIEQQDYYRMRAFFEPYHVRLDMVPGETDFTRNGIPRVYDGLPDEPTYLYIRGDEKKPDKSTIIPPGVPELLQFKELRIRPVSLPAEAWEPERRPGVLETHIEAAQQKVSRAESAVTAASQRLERTRKNAAEAKAKANSGSEREGQGGTAVSEKFETLDRTRWKLFGGNWSHSAGQVEQKRDGKTRSVLQLTSKPPQDFEATFRAVIKGGSLYRSIGLSWDVADGDPTKDTLPTYHEKNVYISAHPPGPKIQAACNDGGKWQYPPPPARKGLPIRVDQEYVVRILVRDRLINAYVNGQLAIAYQSPLPRKKDGRMQLTTFDALAVFREFSLRPLDPERKLQKPSAGSPDGTQPDTDVTGAEEKLALARADLEIARAELLSIRSCAVALRARWSEAPSHQADHIAAVKAVRQVAVAKAKRVAVAAEHEWRRDPANAATEKKNNAARQALQKAMTEVDADIDGDEPLPKVEGARWSATRFLNSGKDDPMVPFRKESTGRRTALASWITDQRNPLTARVAVNHIWMRHMGRPLVATVFDFGRNGAAPTHPELLDWLASEFMETGWSMKHLHRRIVTSAAYRMTSSQADAAQNLQRDPENRFWWRRIPSRLESQAVRDSLLALAGTLDETRGGPTVPRAQQASSMRRSLYFFHSNNDRNLFLTTFDEALVKDCYRREQSIVPQQALALTNSALVLDAAPKIAAGISAKREDEDQFIRAAFALVTGIEASAEELSASRKTLAEWRKLPGGSDSDARTKLVWVLINHNDFVTIR